MLSIEEYNILEETIYEYLDDCINKNETEKLGEHVINLFYNDLKNIIDRNIRGGRKGSLAIKKRRKLLKIITEIVNNFFIIFYNNNNEYVLNDIQNKINRLREIYQPAQKTEEWYKYRHEMITASSIGKIFKSTAQLNSLIYEKCQPMQKQITSKSLQWGQMFESVSIMIYEEKYNTKVAEFGCIRHPQYSFIGASPDGINIDIKSPKYGTMIEVKNIVNRDIINTPKFEYWVQMQIQMEVCDLDYCDFIETRFKEYENIEQYLQEETKKRGIIYIGYSDFMPKYYYCNNLFKKEEIEEWIKKTTIDNNYSFYKIIYWYLDEFSCYVVERNKEWFIKSLPKIKETWETIILERENGCQHRKPKQRILPNSTLFNMN